MSDWIIEENTEQEDAEFFKRADAFIDVANAQMEATRHENISMAFLYAAARFKAFSTSVSMNGAENMEPIKDKIVDELTEDFRKMLQENIEEHIRREKREKQS